MSYVQFKKPSTSQVEEFVRDCETSQIVGAAILALSGDDRSPAEIWDSPTPGEVDSVCMAVDQYEAAGLYDADHLTDCYYWGQAVLTVPRCSISYTLSQHDDGYFVGDWFRGDATTVAQACHTAENADAILKAHYLGPDKDGVEVTWDIEVVGEWGVE